MSTGEDTPRGPGATDEPTVAPPAAPSEATAPGKGPVGASAEAADDDPWPFDDDGAFRVRRREPEPPWPFSSDAPDAPAPKFGVRDEEIALDAFEKAVSQALHDKLGPASDEPRRPGAAQGADELIASVLGALSGKDARTALSEVREQLAAPQRPAERRGADVIDLAAVREARRAPAPPSPAAAESAARIGTALRDTVNAFLAEQAAQTGEAKVTIDADFLKRHGNALLGNLFQGLAETLLPQLAPQGAARPPVGPRAVAPAPAGPAAAEPPPAAAAAAPQHAPASAPPQAAEPPAPGEAASDAAPQQSAGGAARPSAPGGIQVGDVKVTVDLASILANLFRPRPKR